MESIDCPYCHPAIEQTKEKWHLYHFIESNVHYRASGIKLRNHKQMLLLEMASMCTEACILILCYYNELLCFSATMHKYMCTFLVLFITKLYLK